MGIDKIVIKGAKEHNLKNVDLTIPRDQLVVFTGLSGSGKSSLAFDTLYADGQRRYMESLSSYARMFLGQMEKPDVESIEGLSPAISIDQKTTNKNPRSTVGTVTEIYDYFRLLFANIGIPHCPVCGREITQQTVDQMVDAVMVHPEGAKIQIFAPVVRARKGTHKKELESALKSGFIRARVDGSLYELSEEIELDKNKKHTVDILIDRLVVKEEIRSRLADSLETALNLSGGLAIVEIIGGEEIIFSQNYSCPEHGISIDELAPRMFSFNNPIGACEKCTGLGTFLKVDENLVLPNKDLSIREGAIRAPGFYYGKEETGTIAQMYYAALAEHYGFTLDDKVKDIPAKVVHKILYGTGTEKIKMTRVREYGTGTYTMPFEGIIPNMERRFSQTTSNWVKEELAAFMSDTECPDCHGEKLKPVYLAVTVADKNISQLTKLSVVDALHFFEAVELSARDKQIAEGIVKEIKARLSFLESVGLNYLTLSRNANTLSGGESQRIRLATQIGSALTGVLYILDEPSIGLHQRDNDKLIGTLEHLRDLGNSVIVVEHDEDTIRAADYIVDVGPGAGVHGGEIVATGQLKDIENCRDSITGEYLSGKKKIDVPKVRRKGNGNTLKIKGAAENNLKNVNVSIPLGTLTCVTGVSGSGKSSLINQVLYKHLAAKLNRAKTRGGKCKSIEGTEFLDKVIDINQSPIGRTPRSNPATYTGVFTDIREVFAQTQDAKMRGFKSNRFSFNVKGGRCEACEGDGIVKIEMHFLPDIFVPCEVCKGKRYNRETLEAHYRGKNIYDVLEMTVEEGATFFENHPKISRKLQTMCDVGLGYIKIGQSSTTLSGGEAQRVKLATELSKRSTGKTIYILDEPTTGLHTADVHRLVDVLQSLVELGNTVVVIEHNLDVIKCADYIIDLGPEGGELGGMVIAKGTPEKIVKVPESYTGQYLKKYLES